MASLEKLINFEDINKICRYCLNYQHQLKSIFTNEIVEMTKKLLHINNMISSEDADEADLPEFICIKCYDKLIESYRFQSQCLLSLKLLNDLMISRKLNRECVDNHQDPNNDLNGGSKIDQENELTNKKKVQELSICPICGIRVKEKSLKGHINRHSHKSSYECDFCGRCLSSKHGLKCHMFIHMNVRRYKCTICDKSFVERTSLRVHMVNHTNERKYICKVCGRAFTQSCGLGVHMKRHAQKLDYKCRLCNLRFINGYCVKKHEETHNTEYSFKCNLCSKAFTCDNYLKHHYRMTHIKYPIKCNECDQELDNLRTYNKHKKQHEYKII